jgi:hypothetical protein
LVGQLYDRYNDIPYAGGDADDAEVDAAFGRLEEHASRIEQMLDSDVYVGMKPSPRQAIRCMARVLSMLSERAFDYGGADAWILLRAHIDTFQFLMTHPDIANYVVPSDDVTP